MLGHRNEPSKLVRRIVCSSTGTLPPLGDFRPPHFNPCATAVVYSGARGASATSVWVSGFRLLPANHPRACPDEGRLNLRRALASALLRFLRVQAPRRFWGVFWRTVTSPSPPGLNIAILRRHGCSDWRRAFAGVGCNAPDLPRDASRTVPPLRMGTRAFGPRLRSHTMRRRESDVCPVLAFLRTRFISPDRPLYDARRGFANLPPPR